MKNNPRILCCFYILTIMLESSCNYNSSLPTKKPIYDYDNRIIGDSIFQRGRIVRLEFSEVAWHIDSIVINRYNNWDKSIKSVYSYFQGKKVFENIDYFENGKIEKYEFLDANCDDNIYSRHYNKDGSFLHQDGCIPINLYTDTNANENLEVRNNSLVRLYVYYPNPPDCKTFVYHEGKGKALYEVFGQDKNIRFMKTVKVDMIKKGDHIYKALNIGLIFTDTARKLIDTLGSKTFIFKIID